VRHTPTFGLGFGAGSGSSSAAACCNGTSLQTRPLFLLPFPLLTCSSRHYRISSPCHHLTTGTPPQPSPSHLQRPLTSCPAPKWRSLPSPIRTCTDSDTDSQPRLFLHPCARDSAADGIDSTSSHRCGSERRERVPLTRKLFTQALSDLSREAVLLLPMPGAPRRARRSCHGLPPFILPPRERPRRRLHPTVPSYPSIAPFFFFLDVYRSTTPNLIAETTREFGLGGDWMNDPRRCGASLGTRVRHDSRTSDSLSLSFCSHHLAANKDATTTFCASTQHQKCCAADDSSTSAVSPSSLFSGHGPSLLNWCATQSRTPPTAPRCFASASRNARSAGRPPDSSSALGQSLGFSQPRFNAVMLCCTYSSVSSSTQPRTPIPSTIQFRYSSIHPSNADRIVSSMLSLPMEPAYPLDQSSQSLTSTYPCLICVLVPNYACMYHTK